MRNISDKSCRENQNTYFVFSNFFPENLAICEIMWKNMEEPERATDNNTAHAFCMLAKLGYTGFVNAPQCYVIHTLPVLHLLSNSPAPFCTSLSHLFHAFQRAFFLRNFFPEFVLGLSCYMPVSF